MLNHNHNHHAGNHGNFMKKVAVLDNAKRRQTLPPETILEMLPIEAGTSIMDVGAGTGYLTIPAAKQTEAAVYALDLDERMLQLIDTKAKAENLSNIQLIKGNITDIPLPDDSVDMTLASIILHEVSPLPQAIAEITRVLKTGGRFLCLEFEKEEGSAEGAPMHIRIPSDEMEKVLIEAGFQIEQKLFPSSSIYIITGIKLGGAE